MSDARRKFIAYPDADKYKIVFPLSYLEKLYKDPPKNKKEEKEREKERYLWYRENPEEIRNSKINSFIEQLNKAGDQGYRLIALTYPFIAMLRQGNVQYEYAGFEITSYTNTFYTRAGLREDFEKNYAQLAEQGFSVVDHVSLGSGCYDPPGDIFDTSCTYDDLFLLERAKGVVIPRQYRIARHVSAWGFSGSGDKLTKQINDYRTFGFNPILAISEFEVLLQPVTDKPEFLPEPEVKVVSGFNLKKKVNEVAQQGYRLASTRPYIAVMYRNRDTTAPVSYIWLGNSKKKNFEQELARLQESGAIYRMTNGDLDELIFEQPATDVNKRREYKMLKVQFQETKNFAEEKINIDLAQSSKETIKTLDSLVKEGFAVRDLFILYPYARTHDALIAGILLERTQ